MHGERIKIWWMSSVWSQWHVLWFCTDFRVQLRAQAEKSDAALVESDLIKIHVLNFKQLYVCVQLRQRSVIFTVNNNLISNPLSRFTQALSEAYCICWVIDVKWNKVSKRPYPSFTYRAHAYIQYISQQIVFYGLYFIVFYSKCFC
jgi:hypothetical protein